MFIVYLTNSSHRLILLGLQTSQTHTHHPLKSLSFLHIFMSEEKGRPLPKFGDWDVNDPASAEGFTVIFNKARDEKKTGGKTDSPSNVNPGFNQAAAPVKKPPAKKWFCCMQAPSAES